MLKTIVSCLAICAMAAATVAQAQSTGGGGPGGMGGGGHHGRGGGGGGDGPKSGGRGSMPTPKPDKPVNTIEIIGVVRSIDPKDGRVTIDYEEVDALGWPHGSMPFVVEKPDLLQGVSVGEKVRFKLDSHQISELKPFTTGSPTPPASPPAK